MDSNDTGSQEALINPEVSVRNGQAGATNEQTAHSEEPAQCVSRAAPKSCFRRWVTVEPCLMVYFMTVLPLIPLTDQYVLHHIQKENNFSISKNESGCESNTTDPIYIKEQQFQAQASHTVILFTLVGLVPSVFVTVQLGAYSDKMGRKLALLSPLAGGIIRCLLSVVVIQLKLPLAALSIGYFVEGCLGGVSTLVAGCFSYIADITTHKERSMRIFILEVSLGVGVVTSEVAVGYLIRELGFMYPIVILGSLHVLNILYVIFVLEESVVKDRSAKFFSCSQYAKMLTVYGRDNGTGRRWKLDLTLLILFLACVVQLGGKDVATYFQLDSPICFDSVDIGYWVSACYLISNVSSIIFLKLLLERLGDRGIMITSAIFVIAFYVFFAFVTSKLAMYLATILSINNNLIVPMVRSFSSKMVSSDEQGAMFSAIATAETTSILIGNLAFNTIYSATVKPPYFKGTVFLTQAGLVTLAFLLMTVLIIGIRQEKKNRQNTT